MGQVNTTPTSGGSANPSESGCSLKRQIEKTPSYKDSEEPWRMCHDNSQRYYVRKIHRDNWTWHQYASDLGYVKGSVRREEPLVLFACKSQPRKSRHDAEKIDSKCRSVIKALIRHRSNKRCDCNFEYIKTGHTLCESSNICEKRSERVLRAMNKHDKMCGCGTFDFGIQPKPPTSTISKGPGTHTVMSAEDLSDEDCDLFEGLPRKF